LEFSEDGMMDVLSSGQSYVGLARGDNQDSFHICEPDDEHVRSGYGSLYAVADGMGGGVYGDIASSQAIETFHERFYAGRSSHTEQNLRRAIQAANLAVYQLGQLLGGAPMGTTLSAANLISGCLYLAHVGDSRIYLVREGRATCLTRDHTSVGDLVAMRVLSPDKVRAHERRSELHRALGLQLFVKPDITRVRLHRHDTIILCSDGIWCVIEDEEFAALATDLENPYHLGQVLIDLALKRHSDDNLSLVAIRVNDFEPVPDVLFTRRSLARFFRRHFVSRGAHS
jgi:serine/threonine protein phosphatase PrpC